MFYSYESNKYTIVLMSWKAVILLWEFLLHSFFTSLLSIYTTAVDKVQIEFFELQQLQVLWHVSVVTKMLSDKNIEHLNLV